MSSIGPTFASDFSCESDAESDKLALSGRTSPVRSEGNIKGEIGFVESVFRSFFLQTEKQRSTSCYGSMILKLVRLTASESGLLSSTPTVDNSAFDEKEFSGITKKDLAIISLEDSDPSFRNLEMVTERTDVEWARLTEDFKMFNIKTLSDFERSFSRLLP